MDYHIAQVNFARMLGDVDSPVMAEFMANLNPINTLGEQAPGFVWRLKSDDGNSTSIKAYEDPYIIINLSVWETIDSVFQFAYYTAHTEYFRRRGEWFEKHLVPMLALWWVPAGHEPSAVESRERLEYLQQHGATPHAFTFKQRFTAEEWLAYQTEKATER
jgi:hypothetical protein